MRKAVITVVGKDCVGIIAKTCTYLAEKKVNILDISQTIVGGYFNMVMIVDVTGIEDFTTFSNDLEKLGKNIGVIVSVQREDIFDMMHRI